ncbi:LacI family DNA-binding transcriptional regulator [Paenibacillus ginsengarvi]|uniref:LacI family transcriptional regulator n=1 Tax=Paenibacillus ginsengarvi TaxID=400777 RepID=A0A3B0AUX0_9BACL|nr:LacI family DNA-binding transcriptional regulator [Paenibacillus ginsengarvi]RKN64308.1 LacI family transcriptional regulator [Paenibacillus ginsengarvi]
MSKKISMQQIADRLGISKYSVSQALAGKPGVSEETRENVFAMAKALGYRFGLHVDPASSKAEEPLAGVSNPYVLLWIKSGRRSDSTFWNRVLTGVIDACDGYGWDHLIISNNVEETEFVFPAFADRSSCIGMIVLGSMTDSFLISIKKQRIPVVLADHSDPSVGLDCVVNANIEAAKTVCHNLIAAKCRSIMFVGSDRHSVSFQERWWGCKMAASEEEDKRGEEIAVGKWSLPYGGGGPWGQTLEVEVKKMHGGGKLPDGFVCANDEIAIRLISLLKMHGYDVPAQCKVIGFDDVEMAAHSSPALTTVDFGKETLGARSVEMLHRRIASPDAAPEKVTLSFRLIARQSG